MYKSVAPCSLKLNKPFEIFFNGVKLFAKYLLIKGIRINLNLGEITTNSINKQVGFLKRFYLFIHESHRDRGRDIVRGRSRLPAGSPMQG